MKKLSLVLGLCALLALSTTAFGAILCTTPACVSPNDHIGWSSFWTTGHGLVHTPALDFNLQLGCDRCSRAADQLYLDAAECELERKLYSG